MAAANSPNLEEGVQVHLERAGDFWPARRGDREAPGTTAERALISLRNLRLAQLDALLDSGDNDALAAIRQAIGG